MSALLDNLARAGGRVAGRDVGAPFSASQSIVNRDLAVECLMFAVPLHIAEQLRRDTLDARAPHHKEATVYRRAHEYAFMVGEKGDALLMGTAAGTSERSRRAHIFNGLAALLAHGAIHSDTGASLWGLHWCVGPCLTCEQKPPAPTPPRPHAVEDPWEPLDRLTALIADEQERAA